MNVNTANRATANLSYKMIQSTISVIRIGSGLICAVLAGVLQVLRRPSWL